MSDVEKAAIELARRCIAWREWMALPIEQRRATPSEQRPRPHWADCADDAEPDLVFARAILALAAERDAMAKVVEAAEKLFDGKFPPEPPGDWACRECRPYSDTLVAGFRCNHHALRAALDTLRAAKGER